MIYFGALDLQNSRQVNVAGSSVRVAKKHIHRRWGYKFISSIEKPWKTKYKVNITIISQNNYNITITTPFTIQLTQFI